MAIKLILIVDIGLTHYGLMLSKNLLTTSKAEFSGIPPHCKMTNSLGKEFPCRFYHINNFQLNGLRINNLEALESPGIKFFSKGYLISRIDKT